MRLFHLTAEPFWQEIAEAGEIVSVEEKQRRDPAYRAFVEQYVVPASLRMYGKDSEGWWRRSDSLVWLTADPSTAQKWMGATAEKGEIRIEVRTDDAQAWKHYARDKGFPPKFLTLHARSGGNPGDWFVVERPIPRAEWVRVERTSTGEVLWSCLERAA